MLIILSDIHLGDGTCGKSIAPDAFYVLAERLDEMAMRASWRKDGSYHPIDRIEILLLGDILDPLHSTLWLDTQENTPEYTRPWTDRTKPAYAQKLEEITRAILKENDEALSVFRELKVEIPRNLDSQRNWQESIDLVRVKTRIHYMIGNHDWYYRIPGESFDKIRSDVIKAFGLSQSSSPFPYLPKDNPALAEILAEYKVYAQHGDMLDSFNYNAEKGRINSALGDVLTVEITNRFPLEVAKRIPELPESVIKNLREISHVRPVLATWLWVSSQIKHSDLPDTMQKKIKKIWDDIGNDFLNLDVVRKADKKFSFDNVDKLEIALAISKRFSTKTINDLALWIEEEFWGGEISYAKKVLKEPAFLNKEALYIVYGHTHHHEVVPLDASESGKRYDDQLYFNSGTWRTYFDLTIFKPHEQKFIPYQMVSFIAFYKDDQRKGHRYETLSGIFS